MAKVNLSTKFVENLKPDEGKTRVTVFDSETPNMCVRATARGYKFYVLVRDRDKKQRWHEILDNGVPVRKLAEARRLAPEGVARIRLGEDRAFPKLEAKPESFGKVAGTFIKRYVEKEGLRSGPRIKWQLKRYVLPVWADKPFAGITRADVAELLDEIEDQSGATTATRVLGTIRKMMNWYATRNGDFVSPIVPGMGRIKPAERARRRVLSDDEIRAIWPHLEGPFGGVVKILLLTGVRRTKAATLKWQDIADGVWTLPTEPREKNNAGSLILPRMALDVIESQPRIVNCPYVFAGRTTGPIKGFAALKAALDEAVPLPHWTLHDLRRTARTLLARAGVRPDVAEQVLGHVIGGISRVYNIHDYAEEKAEALAKLAGLVDLILNPPAGNVVELETVR
jgi:integrase